jgi:hypothetical protein
VPGLRAFINTDEGSMGCAKRAGCAGIVITQTFSMSYGIGWMTLMGL